MFRWNSWYFWSYSKNEFFKNHKMLNPVPNSTGPSWATPTHIISTVNISVKNGTIVRNLITSYNRRNFSLFRLWELVEYLQPRAFHGVSLLLLYINVAVCVCVLVCFLKGDKTIQVSTFDFSLFLCACIAPEWERERARSSTPAMIYALIGPFHFSLSHFWRQFFSLKP